MDDSTTKLLIVAKHKNVYLGGYITGGQKYSYKLLKEIRQLYQGNIVIMDDSDFDSKGNFIKKVMGYWNNIHKFDEYDYIYFNSTHYYLSLLIRKIKKNNPKCKIIMELHHLDYLSYGKASVHRYLIKAFEIRALKNCDYINVPNEYPCDYIKTHLKINHNKIIRINNVFDRKAVNLRGDKSNCLLYVGTIEPRKGLDLLLKALTVVEGDYRVNIVGKFDEKSKYWRKLQKYVNIYGIKDRVNFLGRVSQEELENLYMKSKAFVFPSLNEGYGLVILEAMEYGLPVIAFDNTAMPYTVKNEYNGFLIKNKDWLRFGNAIQRILSLNKFQYKDLSDGARNTFLETKTDEDLHSQVRRFVELILM